MKYILKVSMKNKYIGIDSNSGGYPYHTDIKRAETFINKQNAIDYSKMFKNEKWELHTLIIDSIHIEDLF
jgi:hypothetical protein